MEPGSSSPQQGRRLLTICLKRAPAELRRRDLPRERAPEMPQGNDPASASPVADENGVVVSLSPDYGLVSYSTEGVVRWTSRQGPFRNFFGMAGSPIIASGMVLLVCDQQTGSFALALTASPERSVENRAARADDGGATPIVFRSGPDRREPDRLGNARRRLRRAPASAWWQPPSARAERWHSTSPTATAYPFFDPEHQPSMPSFHHGARTATTRTRTFACPCKSSKGTGPRPALRLDRHPFGWLRQRSGMDDDEVPGHREFGAIAIKPGASRGQLPQDAVRWRVKRNLPYVPAPLPTGTSTTW